MQEAFQTTGHDTSLAAAGPMARLVPTNMQTVQRESGIHVPADLAKVPDSGKPNQGPPVCYDPDGRRRIVIDRGHRRRLDQVITDMKLTGQAVFMACRVDFKRDDGRPSCGGVMVPEGIGGPDPGFGCSCTRIHFG